MFAHNISRNLTITKIVEKYNIALPWWTMHEQKISQLFLIVNGLNVKFWMIPLSRSWNLSIPKTFWGKKTAIVPSVDRYIPIYVKVQLNIKIHEILFISF